MCLQYPSTKQTMWKSWGMFYGFELCKRCSKKKNQLIFFPAFISNSFKKRVKNLLLHRVVRHPSSMIPCKSKIILNLLKVIVWSVCLCNLNVRKFKLLDRLFLIYIWIFTSDISIEIWYQGLIIYLRTDYQESKCCVNKTECMQPQNNTWFT